MKNQWQPAKGADSLTLGFYRICSDLLHQKVSPLTFPQ